MKISAVVATGKWLMKLSGFRITIIDDQDAYFNDSMLNAAKAIGFNRIERLYRVDQPTLQRLLNDPPHILVLDIKGVSDRDVAKDGLALCALFKKNTKCYVAV